MPPGLGAPVSRRLSSESRPITPEGHAGKASGSSRVKDASQISLGSPVAKSTNKARAIQTELRLATDEKDIVAKHERDAPAESKASPTSAGLPLSTQEGFPVKSECAPSGTFPPASGSASATGSRPNTPLTAASRASESSAPRQPRILRVVETAKPGAPVTAVNTHAAAVPTAGADKTRSRRQSLSSNSRPDTPGDFGSEADFFTSTTASRTNSPPPSSRIGSAPVRSITKSQAKKERRQKAKDAETKKVESAPTVEEVQAPIIGRKRKTKKAPAATVEPAGAASLTVTESASPVKAAPEPTQKEEPKPESAKKVQDKEPVVPEIETVHVDEQSQKPNTAAEEVTRAPSTIAQVIKNAEETGRSIKDILTERSQPIHDLLAEMQRSSGLDLSQSGLFNPANLNQRIDLKCIADDFDALKDSIEFNEEHRKALMRGEPVHGGDQLKDRLLVTPRGSVLRHLEPEEEERYLALEKFSHDFLDPIIVGDDSSNINGGLEALFATPEKFHISWMDEAALMGTTSPTTALETSDSIIPPNVLSAMETDSTRSHDWAVAHSAELLQTTTAAVRSFAAATAKQMLGSAGLVGGNPSLDDIAAMTSDEIKNLASKSQKDLESTRKELDLLDKKFGALLRRNKKIQQQAMSTTTGDH